MNYQAYGAEKCADQDNRYLISQWALDRKHRRRSLVDYNVSRKGTEPYREKITYRVRKVARKSAIHRPTR